MEPIIDDNLTDDLDTSWIHEEERFQNIQSNYYREPIDCINTYFIYINKNQYIDKILCEKQNLEINEDQTESILSKEVLLQIIQSKKTTTSTSKYKLIDILFYNIDLEPENIQSYSKLDTATESPIPLKSIPIFDEIHIKPSIFIFHGINAIYFLFQEVEIEKIKFRKSIKSILKTSNREPEKQKATKKVKITTDNIEYADNFKRHRKTKKTNLIK